MHLRAPIYRITGILLVATVFVAFSPSTGFASTDDAGWGGRTENDSVAVGTASPGEPAQGDSAAQTSTVPEFLHKRQAICQDWIVPGGGSEPTRSFVFEGAIPTCVEPFEVTDDFCADGAEPLAPMWRSQLIDL